MGVTHLCFLNNKAYVYWKKSSRHAVVCRKKRGSHRFRSVCLLRTEQVETALHEKYMLFFLAKQNRNSNSLKVTCPLTDDRFFSLMESCKNMGSYIHTNAQRVTMPTSVFQSLGQRDLWCQHDRIGSCFFPLDYFFKRAKWFHPSDFDQNDLIVWFVQQSSTRRDCGSRGAGKTRDIRQTKQASKHTSDMEMVLWLCGTGSHSEGLKSVNSWRQDWVKFTTEKTVNRVDKKMTL